MDGLLLVVEHDHIFNDERNRELELVLSSSGLRLGLLCSGWNRLRIDPGRCEDDKNKKEMASMKARHQNIHGYLKPMIRRFWPGRTLENSRLLSSVMVRRDFEKEGAPLELDRGKMAIKG